MATKFYFRNTNATGGTLPTSTTASMNGTAGTFTQAASGAGTCLNMLETIGAGQTSVAVSTSAITSLQNSLFRRFVSPALAAQTISSQTVTISLAASESNANSDMFENGSVLVGLWRPSTGAFVNALSTFFAAALTEPGTSQTAVSTTFSSTSRTCLDGDVIIVELVSSQSQAMTVSYTNTVFWDGTTEASTTNCASFINFANTLTFLAAGTTYTKAGFGKESA